MSYAVWNGLSGDWSDGANWTTGAPPPVGGNASIQGSTPETITGSAYFGAADLVAADLTLSGDFSGTALTCDASAEERTAQTNPASLSHVVTISPWSHVSAASVDFQNISLQLQGELLLDRGEVYAMTLSGSESFLGINSQLSVFDVQVLGGAVLNGNVTASSGASISVDDTSSLGYGTITVDGNATLTVVPTSASSETYVLGNGLQVNAGDQLAVDASTNIAIGLAGSLTGSGTISFMNQTLNVQAGGSIADAVHLTASSLTLDADQLLEGNQVELNSSRLMISAAQGVASSPANILCSSGASTISSGAADFNINVAGGSELTFYGGSGSGTLNGGGGSIIADVVGDDTTVLCGSGSGNVVTLSGSHDVVYGSAGAIIRIDGNGSDTVCGGSGNELFDDTASFGSNLFFGGTAGITSVLGGFGNTEVAGGSGSMSITGGGGALLAFGGSGIDTIVGGTGRNTLVGGTGDVLFGRGSADEELVASTGGVLVDASASSGSNTIFAVGGNELTRIVASRGSNLVVSQYGGISVTGSAANETVWGGTSYADTIIGGTGQDVLVGSPGSYLQLNGAGRDLVVASGLNSEVDEGNYQGSATIFAGGSGVSFVTGGVGAETVVATTGTLHAVGGSGNNVVFGGMSGHDTIIGGAGNNTLVGGAGAYLEASGSGSNYLLATSAGDTINAAASSGRESIVCGEASSLATIYTGSGISNVLAEGQSVSVHISGGVVNVTAGGGTLNLILDSGNQAGSLTISDFNPTLDKVSALGSADVLSNASSSNIVGGSTILHFGSEVITLPGFVFPAST